MEDAVEVLGLVIAEACRRIHQPGIRGDDAVLKPDAVDEGLQAGARRTQGARHVDPAAGAVQSAGPDAGAHAARGDIDDDDGDGGVAALGSRRNGGERLQAFLQIGVDRADDGRLQAFGVSRQPAGRMPGQGREGVAMGGQGFVGGLSRLVLVDDMGVDHAVQDQVAREAGTVGVAVGPARFRRLGHRDQ